MLSSILLSFAISGSPTPAEDIDKLEIQEITARIGQSYINSKLEQILIGNKRGPDAGGPRINLNGKNINIDLKK